MLSIFSCHNGIKLGNNNIRGTGNFTKKMWNFNSTLLSNHWVKGEIRQYLRANKNEITTYQNLYTKKFIMLSAYIKKKKDLKQLNFTPQRVRKRMN